MPTDRHGEVLIYHPNLYKQNKPEITESDPR